MVNTGIWDSECQTNHVLTWDSDADSKKVYFKTCGNGNPLQYSCLENPMDRGAWWAVVHRVAKSRTRLSNFTFTHWRKKWQPTPVFLPGESQGWWEPGGLPSMGSHRVGQDWSDLAAAYTYTSIDILFVTIYICIKLNMSSSWYLWCLQLSPSWHGSF